MQTLIQYKKLNPEARAPKAGTEDSAGYDVFANNVKSEIDFSIIPGHGPKDAWKMQVAPNGLVRIGLGLALEIPLDRTVKIEVRSGMANRDWAVEGGRLDPDYRGEVSVLLRNQSVHTMYIGVQEKIAQLIVQERIVTTFLETNELQPTNRGEGGFGSTGII